MGLVVVGLGLFDIFFWYLLFNWVIFVDVLIFIYKFCIIIIMMLIFGMGVSMQVFFVCVGGGIYIKVVDVGVDFVGKVEVGIFEDDLCNFVIIVDNVGDNVGDVVGMGVDLYELYCGFILVMVVLGVVVFIYMDDMVMQFKVVIVLMLIVVIGIIFFIIGIFLVCIKENVIMKDLFGLLVWGINLSLVLIVVVIFFILWLL